MQSFRSDAITSAMFRNDGKLMSVGETDGKLHIVDVKTKGMLRTFRKHSKGVYTTAFLPDVSLIASGSDDMVSIIAIRNEYRMVGNFDVLDINTTKTKLILKLYSK